MAILDWLKEIPLSAVYKERLVDSEKQVAALEKQISILEPENSELKARLSQFEENRRTLEQQIEQKFNETHNSNPEGYACDHCGSKNIKRIGNRPNLTFCKLGVKDSIFSCAGKKVHSYKNNKHA